LWEPLEPVTGHFKHTPGCTGTNKIYISEEFGSRESLCTTQGLDEEEGSRTKATSRLDDKRNDRSGGEDSGGVDSCVVGALSPFVLASGSIYINMGTGWSVLELSSTRVNNCDVDVEGVGALNVLDIGAYIAGILVSSDNLADYEFHAEVCRLNSGVEALDKLVEQITDLVVAGVAGPLVEGTAEGM
jgi:hypothetical protein